MSRERKSVHFLKALHPSKYQKSPRKALQDVKLLCENAKFVAMEVSLLEIWPCKCPYLKSPASFGRTESNLKECLLFFISPKNRINAKNEYSLLLLVDNNGLHRVMRKVTTFQLGQLIVKICCQEHETLSSTLLRNMKCLSISH